MWGNNNKNEAAAQAARANFFNNPQSLSAQMVSCHISVVLSKLSNKYLVFGGQNSAAMKAARQSVYIKAFNDFIQSKEWFASNPKFVAAIAYIETLMAEAPNEQDQISFWKINDELGIPSQTSLTISVRETLAVVCAALMDDKVYRYESADKREEEKAERVKSLCDCLVELSENMATHESTRHRLAFCLNYNYPDIKFITAEFNFIWPHIRQAVVKKLFLESQWQTHFKTIVWPWIKEGEMPQVAWDLLNNANQTVSSNSTSSLFVDELKDSLAVTFLTYGLLIADKSTDSAKTTNKFINTAINDCCNRICDMDFPGIASVVITRLHHFMRSLRNLDKKKKEIVAFVQWLESSFDPDDNKHVLKFNKFFEIYEILGKINRYGYVLKTSKTHNELLSTLKPMIDEYIENNLEISEAFRTKINAFNRVYSRFIEDSKAQWIEGFFELWFKHRGIENNDERARLFYQLCNPDSQGSITVSDQEIINKCGLSDSNSVVEIDVYFLNRCLLHALTVPVLEWSELFYNTLKRLYQFILNDFNTAEMRGIPDQLKKSSYPNALLRQIKYFLECYELRPNKPTARPAHAVLTPTVIETSEEVFQGLWYVAMTANGNDFLWLPDAIAALKNKVKTLSINRLVQVLRKCPDDAIRLHFLRNFIAIMSDISNVSLIDLMNCFLTDDLCMYVLESIKTRMLNLVGDEVTAVLCIFTKDEYRLQAFAILIDRLNRHALSATELMNVLFEFKSVASAKEAASSLEKQIEVFRNLLLINEFQPPTINKKIKFDQIFDAAQLSQRYIARSSALVTFPTNNRLYLGEIMMLGELTRSKSNVAFEKVVEKLAELLIIGKKEINFDDDLFVMLHSIRTSMQSDAAANEVVSAVAVPMRK